MKRTEFFRILDRVGSTNNYAMAELHAGMAKHGMAWFAREQNAGKGQRGKQWLSNPGENIIMSMVIEPQGFFWKQPFVFNMVVSNACHVFLSAYCKDDIKVKWPNDIYLRDRKAGGILIENVYRGNLWKWAVVGIGINVNQIAFPEDLRNAVSLKKITGEDYDTIALAKSLHQMLLDSIASAGQSSIDEVVKTYNRNLYMANKKIRLRKQNMVFQTTINGVNEQGQLLTTDSMPRQFDFGEVEWIL